LHRPRVGHGPGSAPCEILARDLASSPTEQHGRGPMMELPSGATSVDVPCTLGQTSGNGFGINSFRRLTAGCAATCDGAGVMKMCSRRLSRRSGHAPSNGRSRSVLARVRGPPFTILHDKFVARTCAPGVINSRSHGTWAPFRLRRQIATLLIRKRVNGPPFNGPCPF